jgi:hypothetical protein
MLVLALEFSRGGTAHTTSRRLRGFGCERGDSAGDALIGTIGSAVSPGNGQRPLPQNGRAKVRLERRDLDPDGRAPIRKRIGGGPTPVGVRTSRIASVQLGSGRFGLNRQSLLRKEVIQPHLPVRLPCYDFTPITDPTFDGSLPKGLGHRLRVLPTFVV